MKGGPVVLEREVSAGGVGSVGGSVIAPGGSVIGFVGGFGDSPVIVSRCALVAGLVCGAAIGPLF